MYKNLLKFKIEILTFAIILGLNINSYSQVYNPSQHQPISKPFGVVSFPLDGRSMFYDVTNFKYRPYLNVSEVLTYLPTQFRKGNFEIIVNTGGTLSAGVITGGTNDVYWFKDGILNSNLVLKGSSDSYQKINGISAYLSKNTSKSYTSFGNSITFGLWASSENNKYAQLIAGRYGLPLNNTGIPGDQAADIQQKIYSTAVNGQSYQMFTAMTGANDVTYYGADADKQANYKSIIDASIAWLNIPINNKILGQSTAITYTGSWSNAAYYNAAISKVSTTNGDNASFTISGSVIYVAYTMLDGNAGQMSVTVDGISQGTLNNYGQNNSTIATFNGVNYGSGLKRISGLSNTSHTVSITVTSATGTNNKAIIDWAGSNSGLGGFSGAPILVQGEVPIRFSSTNVATYNNLVRQSVNTLKSDGMNVFTAYTQNVTNPSTDLASDGAHPNDSGHRKLANAFINRIDSVYNITNADSSVSLLNVKSNNKSYLDVRNSGTTVSNLSIKGISSDYDGANLGSELTSSTGWVSTGWTGDYTNGFTHTAGNTSALTYPIQTTAGSTYLVEVGSAGGSGATALSLGGVNLTSTIAGAVFQFTATATGNVGLAFTPQSGYTGTLRGISVRQIIGSIKPSITFRSSDSIPNMELRVPRANSMSIGVNSGLKYQSTAQGNFNIGNFSHTNVTTGKDNLNFGNRNDMNVTGVSNTLAIGNDQILPQTGSNNTASIFNYIFMTGVSSYTNGLLGLRTRNPAQALHVNGAGLFAGPRENASGSGGVLSYSNSGDNTFEILALTRPASIYRDIRMNAREYYFWSKGLEKAKMDSIGGWIFNTATKLATYTFAGNANISTGLTLGYTAQNQMLGVNGGILAGGTRNATGKGLILDYNGTDEARILANDYTGGTGRIKLSSDALSYVWRTGGIDRMNHNGTGLRLGDGVATTYRFDVQGSSLLNGTVQMNVSGNGTDASFDTYYRGASGNILRLPIGNGVLRSNGAAPFWDTVTTTQNYSGSGNGSSTTISIPHGLSGISSTSAVLVGARNAASAGISYWTSDATNIYIIYTVAPVSGTNNLLYTISIKP